MIPVNLAGRKGATVSADFIRVTTLPTQVESSIVGKDRCTLGAARWKGGRIEDKE